MPPAVGQIVQLLCSPIGNWNFRKENKTKIATEWTPHSVFDMVHVAFVSMFFAPPNLVYLVDNSACGNCEYKIACYKCREYDKLISPEQ